MEVTRFCRRIAEQTRCVGVGRLHRLRKTAKPFVEQVLKPMSLDEGMTVAAFKDPDGNVFRLIEFVDAQAQ